MRGAAVIDLVGALAHHAVTAHARVDDLLLRASRAFARMIAGDVVGRNRRDVRQLALELREEHRIAPGETHRRPAPLAVLRDVHADRPGRRRRGSGGGVHDGGGSSHIDGPDGGSATRAVTAHALVRRHELRRRCGCGARAERSRAARREIAGWRRDRRSATVMRREHARSSRARGRAARGDRQRRRRRRRRAPRVVDLEHRAVRRGNPMLSSDANVVATFAERDSAGSTGRSPRSDTGCRRTSCLCGRRALGVDLGPEPAVARRRRAPDHHRPVERLQRVAVLVAVQRRRRGVLLLDDHRAVGAARRAARCAATPSPRASSRCAPPDASRSTAVHVRPVSRTYLSTHQPEPAVAVRAQVCEHRLLDRRRARPAAPSRAAAARRARAPRADTGRPATARSRRASDASVRPRWAPSTIVAHDRLRERRRLTHASTWRPGYRTRRSAPLLREQDAGRAGAARLRRRARRCGRRSPCSGSSRRTTCARS